MTTSPPSAPSALTERDITADKMLAAARQGSNRAWAALLERVDPTCRTLAHLVLGGHDTDEVLLNAYVRAYRARRKGGDDAVVAVLHHVWMACGHEIRRRQRRGDPAPGRRAERVEHAPRFGEDARAQAVATLGPEERAVWALCTVRTLEVDRVAEALGVTPEVVDGVATRSRVRVAEALVVATEPATVVSDDPDLTVDLTDDEPVETDAPDDDEPDAEEAEPAPPPTSGSLTPPPPTAEFWRELGRRLRSEREALPAAPPPSLPEPGAPSPTLTPAKAPPVAMQKRAPARARRSRPDGVDELADEVERQRAPRRWTSIVLRVAIVLVVLGVIGGVVALAYDAASTARSPVRENSVASVTARSMDVLADADTWSATVEQTEVVDGEEVESTLQVVAARDGSSRVEEASVGRLTTYAAPLGAAQDGAEGFETTRQVGLALGPPDASAPRTDTPVTDLGLVARTLVPLTDVEAVRSEVDGRQVWRAEGALDDDTEVTYLVDVDGLVPVEITWRTDGEVVRQLRFTDVDLDAELASFTPEDAEGAPTPTDLGFVPVPITEVAEQVDLTAPTPDYLPTGYVFTGVAVNPAERIVSLRYARGPAQVVISLRPSPVEAGKVWDDPFTRPVPVEPKAVELGAGPFRTSPAQQVTGGEALASIWVADGELALTVAGDLPPEEMLEVARSIG